MMKNNLSMATIKKKRIRTTWYAMIKRCYDKNCKSFKNYGFRGITVCEQWKDSFENFWNDMENSWAPEKNSIDRINNNGNYELSNCQWLSISDNSKKMNINRVENGTHPFSGNGTFQREIQQQRIKNKTHNFLNKNHATERNLRRVNQGTHHFLGGEISRKAALYQLENNIHPSQIKISCIYCKREFGIGHFHRWHGDKCKLKTLLRD